MPSFDVTITKVFGASATNTVTIDAKNKYEAIELAKEVDWSPVYNSMTQSNLSDSYSFAEIIVDDEVMEDTLFSSELLNEAGKQQKGMRS